MSLDFFVSFVIRVMSYNRPQERATSHVQSCKPPNKRCQMQCLHVYKHIVCDRSLLAAIDTLSSSPPSRIYELTTTC